MLNDWEARQRSIALPHGMSMQSNQFTFNRITFRYGTNGSGFLIYSIVAFSGLRDEIPYAFLARRINRKSGLML